MRLAPALISILCFAGPAAAGSVRGTVTFAGSRPPAARLAVTRDQAYCGTSHPDEALSVDANGHVRDAVVFVENAPKTPLRALLKDATLDQVSCRYVPHVQALRVGTKLVAVNSDSALHTVHGTADGQTVFNQAQPIQGLKSAFPITRPGLIHVGCDAGHTWMSAWVYAFDHSYFAVTGESGGFEIGDLPPGTYTIVAWQEKLGTMKRSVQVGKEGAVSMNLTFPAAP